MLVLVCNQCNREAPVEQLRSCLPEQARQLPPANCRIKQRAARPKHFRRHLLALEMASAAMQQHGESDHSGQPASYYQHNHQLLASYHSVGHPQGHYQSHLGAGQGLEQQQQQQQQQPAPRQHHFGGQPQGEAQLYYNQQHYDHYQAEQSYQQQQYAGELHSQSLGLDPYANQRYPFAGQAAALEQHSFGHTNHHHYGSLAAAYASEQSLVGQQQQQQPFEQLSGEDNQGRQSANQGDR